MNMRLPSRRPGFIVRLIIGAVVILALILVACTVISSYLWRDAPGNPSDPPAVVVVEPGTGLRAVAQQLEAAGVIADDRGFVLLAKKQRVATKIQAGEYAVSHGLPMQAVLNLLVQGRRLQHKFTVVPGETAVQVAAALAEAGLDPEGKAAALIVDPAFAASLGVPAPKLEGFLFPETYSYERGDDVKTMLTRMVGQFQKIWTPRFADQAKKQQMTLLQVVTLASIVIKEAGYVPERPQVARVFLNRLRVGMPLQADPTVIYALGEKYQGRLLTEHLRIYHAYNTYTRKGLPPGPICSPGAVSLAAALQPAEGNWLYFVADGAGKHVFSETLAEHNEAVRRYRSLPH